MVGAANSAGQAAVFLSRHARRVTLLVRSDDLGRSMSYYLVRQIDEEEWVGMEFEDSPPGLTIPTGSTAR